MRWAITLALTITVANVPAFAESRFAIYEGKDSIVEGRGGTKEVSNGIDWWVSGSPPRKFQILGTITDNRKDKLLSGKAIGSKKITKMVLDQGGNAVIVLNQDSQYAGSTGVANVFGDGNYGSVVASGRAVHNITTTFVVVKYLEQ